MGFTSIPQSMINVGRAIVQSLLQYIKDDLDYLNGQIGSLGSQGILNGSFEFDTNNDGIPDSWTRQLYSGGRGGRCPSMVLGTDGVAYTCKADHTADSTNKPVTGANWATYWTQTGATTDCVAWTSGEPYRAQDPAHGAKGVFFVHPGGTGNGGGSVSSDYFAISGNLNLSESIGFFHWATNNLMRNQCILDFYDKAKLFISSTAVYDCQDNPTTPVFIIISLNAGDVPSNARYVKVRLVGGESSINQSGTAYFDGVVWNPLEIQQVLAGGSVVGHADFTLAQYGTASTSYVDQGSVYVIPNNNILPILRAYPMQLVFNAELWCSNGYNIYGYQRWRLGSSYSSECSVTMVDWSTVGPYTLTIPANSGGRWLIYQQLHSSSGSYTIYGRKSNSAATLSGAIIT